MQGQLYAVLKGREMRPILTAAAGLVLLAGCSSAAARPTATVTVTQIVTQPAPIFTQTVTPSPSSAPVADFRCTMDSPGDGGSFTLTISNPGTSAINVATVQLNFYDQGGTLIDTHTTDVTLQVNPGQTVVSHGAEEESTSPYSCQETSWSEQ
jgi:hypothetical protein